MIYSLILLVYLVISSQTYIASFHKLFVACYDGNGRSIWPGVKSLFFPSCDIMS